MDTERLSVTIHYIVDTGEEHVIELSPEEYFDLDDSDDRTALDIDSTPKYQEVRGYIKPERPLRQARVRVRDTLSNSLWEVNESYWNQYGDRGISVTVLEFRNGTRIDLRKYIRIRFSDGKERVLTLVGGDEFPLLDEYMVLENDALVGVICLERGGLFQEDERHKLGEHPRER
jgi:hypothetical protein